MTAILFALLFIFKTVHRSKYFFPTRTATGRKWPMALLGKHSHLTAFVYRFFLALRPADVSANLPWPADFWSTGRQPSAGGGHACYQLCSTIRTTGKSQWKRTGGGRGRGTQELQKASPLSHVQSDGQFNLTTGSPLQWCVQNYW